MCFHCVLLMLLKLHICVYNDKFGIETGIYTYASKHLTLRETITIKLLKNNSVNYYCYAGSQKLSKALNLTDK